VAAKSDQDLDPYWFGSLDHWKSEIVINSPLFAADTPRVKRRRRK
jgi:hypothetical protein